MLDKLSEARGVVRGGLYKSGGLIQVAELELKFYQF